MGLEPPAGSIDKGYPVGTQGLQRCKDTLASSRQVISKVGVPASASATLGQKSSQ